MNGRLKEFSAKNIMRIIMFSASLAFCSLCSILGINFKLIAIPVIFLTSMLMLLCAGEQFCADNLKIAYPLHIAPFLVNGLFTFRFFALAENWGRFDKISRVLGLTDSFEYVLPAVITVIHFIVTFYSVTIISQWIFDVFLTQNSEINLISKKSNVSISPKKEKVFLFSIFTLGILLLSQNSSMSPLHIGISETDSSVFRYVARVMVEGGVPYRDTFDHKGPLIYLINYLSALIHPDLGVWVMDLLAVAVTVMSVFLISRLFCNNRLSVISSVVVMAAFAECFENGNYTESYAMPMVAISIYIFLKYFKADSITILDLILCGACGGGVLMLRPNMAATWLVFPIFVFINELNKKRAKNLIRLLIWFILGVALTTVPFIIYFASEDALTDFFDVYIKFNLEYSGNGLASMTTTVLFFTVIPMFLVSVGVIAAQLKKRKDVLLNSAYLVYFAVSVLAISMSRRLYKHYGMILVPAFAYPIALIASRLHTTDFHAKRKVQIILSWLFIFLCPLGYIKPLTVTVEDLQRLVTTGSVVVENDELYSVADYIKKNTDDNERIFAFGNHNQIYLACDRLSASRYSYQTPICEVDDDIRKEFFEDINKNEPAAIVISAPLVEIYGDLVNEMKIYLSEHKYYVVFENKTYTVYQKQ